MSFQSRGAGSNRVNGVARRSAYRPEGDPFPDEYVAADAVKGWDVSWSYAPPWSERGCTVLRKDLPNNKKEYRVVSYYKGSWYISLPEPPYDLYRKHTLCSAEVVYVCEGEYTADAASDIGLISTTSLCGPTKAAMSDWSPLEGKHVVILRDFDDEGMRYAQDVAQLVLTAGALSAKIVTLPGLNESEDLVEWIDGRDSDEECAAMRAEIEAMALLAPFVERLLPDGTRTEICRLSDVEPETQDWVLGGVIPCGALTLITGEAGVGKSFFTLSVAAAVTRGGCGTAVCEPAAVVLFTASDWLARTVRPRLEAAGADLSLVFAVRGTENVSHSYSSKNCEREKSAFQLGDDLATLETKLLQLKDDGIQVRLIIIDPISRFLGAGQTRFDADEIASRLAELANRTGAAIVLVADSCVSVDGKGGGRSSCSTIDQNAIAAEARSIWKIDQDPDNSNRRRMSPIKTGREKVSGTVS